MRVRACVVAAVTTILVLAGCTTFYDAVGGRPGGRLQIFVDWPARTRFLPSYAESVVVTLYPYCCRAPETLIINRPSDAGGQTDVDFWKIPRTLPDDEDEDYFLYHECLVLAKSKPDGRGETVAVLDFYFRFDKFNYYKGFNVTADLEATAWELRADPPQNVKVGQTFQLHGYAVDSAGHALILPAGALLWSPDAGTEFADITPAGLVTAKKAGAFKARLEEVDGQVPSLVVAVPIVDP